MGRVGGIEVAFKSQQQLGFIFIEKNTACSQLLLTMEKQAKLQTKVKVQIIFNFHFCHRCHDHYCVQCHINHQKFHVSQKMNFKHFTNFRALVESRQFSQQQRRQS